MAFTNKEAWEKVDPAWRSGVEYIYQQFLNTLESHGFKLFGEIGDSFDPTLYEAIEEDVTTEETQDHKVAKVIQKGFLLGEQILRPARVKVYILKK